MNRGVKTQHLIRASASQNVREGTFCKYSHRDCMQNCIEGHHYCIRHILEDKSAPYRQCAYITKAGKKCPSAAPKHEKKESYCAFHTKKALIARQRLARKRRPRETADSLLEDLVVSTSSMDSHHHTVEHRRGKVHSDSLAARALDYASSSDSETEALMVEHCWRDSGDSDAESIDSDQEDVLKYAGVYTTEEVAQVLRDKLIRLQALYIDQFKRLKHILLTKRKRYLRDQKVERELYGSIKLYKEDPQQREKYEKLRAMKRYHNKFGMEALMQRQSTHRRMKVTVDMGHRVSTPPRCVFMDEGERCAQLVVPLSKYCQKHILHDQNQVLYRPCPFADSQCGRPVPTLLGSPFCSLHQAIPLTSAVVTTENPKPDNAGGGDGAGNCTGNDLDIKPDVTEVKMEVETDVGSSSGGGGVSNKTNNGVGACLVPSSADGGTDLLRLGGTVKCEATGDGAVNDDEDEDALGGCGDDDEEEDVLGLR